MNIQISASLTNPTTKALTAFLIMMTLLFSAAGVRPAYAATTWTVTSMADDGTDITGACPHASECRLRKALSLAAPGDTIVFDEPLAGHNIFLQDTLTFSNDINIDGSSLSTPVSLNGDSDEDASADVRIITVNSGVTAILDSISLTMGKSPAFGGGAILNNGTLIVNNSSIKYSTATGNGGGAILNWGGTLTVTDSEISNNTASAGGGIVNYNGTTTITNSSFYYNSTTGNSSGAGIINFGTLTVTGSIFGFNSTASGGGAIYNSDDSTTVTNSTFFDNQANVGGAIYTIATLDVSDSTFSGNASTFAGGAINTSGDTTIKDSTFNSNSSGTKGGAISSTSNNTTITNSTFSGNSAVTVGGGVYSWVTGIAINSSTFSGNWAPVGKGGGIYNDGPMQLTNTIIANSVAGGDCKNGSGNLSVNVNNLVEDGSCGATISGDPKLGPLANNGGPTQTMALIGGSPAINAADDAACAAAPVSNLDQRGVTRPVGGHCDIGAYESPFTTVTYMSNGAQDGWVLESNETSNTGLTSNSANAILFLGDDSAKKQYRGILSFSTAALPDTAVIGSVWLKVKQQGIIGGGDPVNFLQGFMADVKTGPFGAIALQAVDFQTTATASYGPLPSTLVGGWYSLNLSNSKNHINKLASGGGLTQIRLRFKLDDNNNAAANYLSLFSGNAAAASRPQLIIQYYVP